MRAAHLSVAALIASCALAPAQAAVIATGGAVQVTGYSQIAGGGYSLSDSMSAPGVPAGLFAQVNNIIFNNGYTQSNGAVNATWNAADVGQVQFFGFGWFLHGTVGDEGQAAALNGGGPNWTYDFVLTAPSQLSVNYNVTGTNNTFGLQGWFLADNGNTILDLLDVFDPTASGTFNYALGAGAHSLTLSNNANISTEGYLVDYRGDMEGLFDWSITAVPEPGTWALLLTGFGTIGYAMRRRTRAVAA